MNELSAHTHASLQSANMRADANIILYFMLNAQLKVLYVLCASVAKRYLPVKTVIH